MKLLKIEQVIIISEVTTVEGLLASVHEGLETLQEERRVSLSRQNLDLN